MPPEDLVDSSAPVQQLQLLQAKHLDLRAYLESQACCLYYWQLLPLMLLVLTWCSSLIGVAECLRWTSDCASLGGWGEDVVRDVFR
jgi:hypothetical protein